MRRLLLSQPHTIADLVYTAFKIEGGQCANCDRGCDTSRSAPCRDCAAIKQKQQLSELVGAAQPGHR